MAYTEFYVQTTGSNMNGGSDNADAAAYTSTNGNWSTSTNIFTPASGNPSSSGVVVGQFASVYLDGATTPVYGARVTAVSATTITLSSTAKWGTPPTTLTTGRSIKCGGAWKGPNAAVAFPFGLMAGTATNAAGNQPRVNFKSGTNYAITAAMTHAINTIVTFQGYTTTVGDGGKAIIDGGTSGTSYILLSLTAVSNGGQALIDLIFQNNGATGAANGVVINSLSNLVLRCVFHDLRGNGLWNTTVSETGNVVECEAYNCNQSATTWTGGFSNDNPTPYVRCISHDHAGVNGHGFVNHGGPSYYVDCIADTCGGNGIVFMALNVNAIITGCVVYNCGASGIYLNGVNNGVVIENCILANNTGYGVDGSVNTGGQFLLRNNAYVGNTTAQTNIPAAAGFESGAITLTALPFIDAPNGDFRLNRSLLARGAGRGAFTQTQASYGSASVVGFPDVGALQHREPFGIIPSIATIG